MTQAHNSIQPKADMKFTAESSARLPNRGKNCSDVVGKNLEQQLHH